MKAKKLILEKINKSKTSIFLRSDFNLKLNYSYTSKILKQLVEEEKLIKVGKGIYIRTRINRITNLPMIDHNGGFDGALIEILERLNETYKISNIAKDYIEGKTTQIPANLNIKPSNKFKRKLKLGKYKFNY